MQKVSVVTHSRISARKKRLMDRHTKKTITRIHAATRGKCGDPALEAGFYAMMQGISDSGKPRGTAPRPPVITHHSTIPRRARQRGSSSRSSASSGDSNEPDPERPLQQLFSFTSAAKLLDCSPQTLRNKVCLGLVPAPIQTEVGPRFTQDQLRQITTLTPTKPIPADVVPPVRRRKVGRPRLASASGKGGAS